MPDDINLVFSYQEAAALCHCAPGTLKSRGSRACAVLVEQLEAGSAPESGVRRDKIPPLTKTSAKRPTQSSPAKRAVVAVLKAD